MRQRERKPLTRFPSAGRGADTMPVDMQAEHDRLLLLLSVHGYTWQHQEHIERNGLVSLSWELIGPDGFPIDILDAIAFTVMAMADNDAPARSGAGDR
jgi:hypothetical protein